MKVVCLNPECKKTFLHCAKKTVSNTIGLNTSPIIESIEIYVCPYCKSPEFEEYIEPKTIEKISSVKSVELAEVDGWIAQGYEVKELYAKTATMVKKEKT